MTIHTYLQAAAMVALKPNKVYKRPIHIQIEPTDACNLDCSFCARSKVIKKARVMSLAEFQRIIDDIRPRKVTLSGYGEPLLVPHLPEMIAHAKSRGASVNTTTNLTRLDEMKAERLIRSGLDLVNVSIDAATPEIYRLGRGEDYFDEIVKGVRMLLQLKTRLDMKKPYVRISFVIYKGNLREVADFVRLAHDLKVNVAFYQILALTSLYDRKEQLIAGVPYTEFKAALEDGVARAKELGVRTNLGQLLADLPEYWSKYDAAEATTKQCSLPWFSTYITANGSLRPCCKFAPVPIDMGGSVLEKSFDEVWNSRQYQHFRESHRRGERPTRVCRECVPETLLDIGRRMQFSPGYFIE